MKNYFEYPFNREIKKKLNKYYENLSLNQHGINHFRKSNLKLKRIKNLVLFDKYDYVIDIGCSRGDVLKILSKEIKEGLGIDISKSIIKENNSKNSIENISFKFYDKNKFNLKQKFDKVLLLDVLEHSFYPNNLIKEIHKVIKRNGKLIIQVPFTGWLSELMFGAYHQGHLRYYDPKYLFNYLKKSGFEIKKIKVYNSVPYSSFFLKFKFIWKIQDLLVNLIPSRFYPYFGEILIIAEIKEKLDSKFEWKNIIKKYLGVLG